jgi:hypothetical protein
LAGFLLRFVLAHTCTTVTSPKGLQANLEQSWQFQDCVHTERF